MKSLRELGLLSQDTVTAQYMLGSRHLTWAGVYSSSVDVCVIAQSALRELHHATQETISLYLLEGNERVCVERLESPQNVRIIARLGRRLPLYAGSAGKVFLAFMPSNRREQILDSVPMIKLTANTIDDRSILYRELDRIRSQGYATSTGEWILEASGVAAPVFHASGEIAAVVTISGPSQRFTPGRMAEYAVMVTRVAAQVSVDLGFRSEHRFLKLSVAQDADRLRVAD